MADADIPLVRYGDFADTVSRYLDEVKKLADTKREAAEAQAGKTVYGMKCRSCHGANGEGNPAIAKALKTEIKPLMDPEVQSMSEADIKKIIMEGKGKMKPVAVSGADLDNVAAYVKSLKK
jgi:mono/diheme cytochrome c family protein